MTTSPATILLLLAFHWVFDFVFQSSWMAMNKSKSTKALSAHVGVYMLGMALAGIVILGFTPGAFAFATLNGVIHYCVDFGTSRWTGYLWKKQDVHNFFVVIGFDQLIHATTLIWSIGLFTS